MRLEVFCEDRLGLTRELLDLLVLRGIDLRGIDIDPVGRIYLNFAELDFSSFSSLMAEIRRIAGVTDVRTVPWMPSEREHLALSALLEAMEERQVTLDGVTHALPQPFFVIATQNCAHQLGTFPLPVEVIPMAAGRVARQFKALGGTARLRLKDGQPLVTDNGQHILDITGLKITDPLQFESDVNQWPGVVTVGVFAHQKAQVCLLGTSQGVRTLEF